MGKKLRREREVKEREGKKLERKDKKELVPCGEGWKKEYEGRLAFMPLFSYLGQFCLFETLIERIRRKINLYASFF